MFVLKLALLQDPDKTPRARRHYSQGGAGPGGAQEPPEHGAPSPPGDQATTEATVQEHRGNGSSPAA